MARKECLLFAVIHSQEALAANDAESQSHKLDTFCYFHGLEPE